MATITSGTVVDNRARNAIRLGARVIETAAIRGAASPMDSAAEVGLGFKEGRLDVDRRYAA